MAPRIIQSGRPDRIGRVVPPVDAGSLTLPTGDIACLRVDHQCHIQLTDAEIVIEDSFFVAVADGQTWALDPGERDGLGPFLAIYPDEVVRSSVEADGALVVVTSAGTTITVPPNERYEAWEVRGPGSQYVVSAPGGELSIFD